MNEIVARMFGDQQFLLPSAQWAETFGQYCLTSYRVQWDFLSLFISGNHNLWFHLNIQRALPFSLWISTAQKNKKNGVNKFAQTFVRNLHYKPHHLS